MNQFDDDFFFDDNQEVNDTQNNINTNNISELDRVKNAINYLEGYDLIMSLVENCETGSLITKEYASLDKYNDDQITNFVRQYNNRLYYMREAYYDMTEGQKDRIPSEISYDLKDLMIMYNRRDESKIDPGYKMPKVQQQPSFQQTVYNQQYMYSDNGEIRESSTTATLALVFAFLSPLISIICAIIGIRKYKTPSLRRRCIIALVLAIVMFAISFAYELWYLYK